MDIRERKPDATEFWMSVGDDEEELVSLPTKKTLCSACRGEGTTVNPSIDSQGISPEEFADDPDFAEDYFSGRFDVTCYHCSGLRVVDVVDESAVEPEVLSAYRDHLDDEAAYRSECAAERAMGA